MSVPTPAVRPPAGSRLVPVLVAIVAVLALAAGTAASALLLRTERHPAEGVAGEFLEAYFAGECDRVAELAVPLQREYHHNVCEQNTGEWQFREVALSRPEGDGDVVTVAVTMDVRQGSAEEWQPVAAEMTVRRVEAGWLVESLSDREG